MHSFGLALASLLVAVTASPLYGPKLVLFRTNLLIMFTRADVTNIAERDTATATITLLPNICGDSSTGIESTANYVPGSSSGCVGVTTPFNSVLVTGDWLGYKLWTDAKCQTLATVSKVDGKPNCITIEGTGAMAWSYTNL
jgi:hypothetical protein